MIDVTTTIGINAPLEKVRTYACDPDHAPEWYVNIESVVWKTPRPLKTGTLVMFVAKFLARELVYTYEVVEYSDHKFVMKTSEGPFPMETTYLFEVRNQDATFMTLRNKGIPSGFSKLFTPFISFMMKRANKKDLEKLKFIVEGSIARKLT